MHGHEPSKYSKKTKGACIDYFPKTKRTEWCKSSPSILLLYASTNNIPYAHCEEDVWDLGSHVNETCWPAWIALQETLKFAVICLHHCAYVQCWFFVWALYKIYNTVGCNLRNHQYSLTTPKLTQKIIVCVGVSYTGRILRGAICITISEYVPRLFVVW